MDDILDLQQISEDLEFGSEELDIVQESYNAVDLSAYTLRNAKHPSQASIKLHRIHAQSLANRLGINLNTVSVESFSPKTMHAFALEESEGFLSKVGNTIKAIFKWIKDKIVGFFNWVLGLFGGKKAEKSVQVVETAAEVVEEVETETTKEGSEATITVKKKKTGQTVTEKKPLPNFNVFTKNFIENPKKINGALVRLARLQKSLVVVAGESLDLGSNKFATDTVEKTQQMGTKLLEHWESHFVPKLKSAGLKEGDTLLSEYHIAGYTKISAEEAANLNFSGLKIKVGPTDKLTKELADKATSLKVNKTSLRAYAKEYRELLNETQSMLRDRKSILATIDNTLSHYDAMIKETEKTLSESGAHGPMTHERYAGSKANMTFMSLPSHGARASVVALASFYAAIARADHYVQQICKIAVKMSDQETFDKMMASDEPLKM